MPVKKSEFQEATPFFMCAIEKEEVKNWELWIDSTVEHEYVHYLEDQYNVAFTRERGSDYETAIYGEDIVAIYK